MEKIIFKNKLAIGDNLIFTVALRELHRQHPNRFQIGVSSYYPEVYFNNPYVTDFTKFIKDLKDMSIIYMDYSHEFQWKKESGKHFAQGYISCLNKKLNLNIELTNCRPEIYLAEEEITRGKDILEENNINKDFWLLFAGYKPDITLKNYSSARWQEFVYLMKEKGIEIVQVGDKNAINPRLKGCKNLIGKLGLRELFAMAFLSKGLIGHVSLQMHLAACFNKPCVVVAGGRENISWNCYNNQQYLHSNGYLNCCKETGCWKRDIKDCSNFNNGISRCMELIEINQIVDCVLKYENILVK